jgi:AcrR family transcriptional regulator
VAEVPSKSRRPRADAERNRQRLLEAAKSVLARDGASASLEEIARTAGVGIGTLYRHFPKRDDLIEAVYHQAVSQLGEAAEQLSTSHAPADALREWLLLFIDYMSTKRLMAEALNSLDGGASRVYAGSGDIMRQALNGLVQRAEAAGEIRAVADPFDLLRAVAGIHYISPESDWEPGARAMVDIVIAGLRKA